VPNGGSEKRIIAELAIFREIQKENFGKIVYVSPHVEFLRTLYSNWKDRLGEKGLGLDVDMLTDDFTNQLADFQELSSSDILLCTPEKWDFLSRKWRQKKEIQDVSLILFDNLHLLGSVYEVIMSRTR
jgi:replicative superfamily II helicase